MADGREKRKRGFLSKVWRRLRKGWWRRRWEPESPQTGVAGVSGQGRQVDRFVATKPRCPGFTGPVIVGVVWKKQFVCSGERNEERVGSEKVECGKGQSMEATTPCWPGFTGPVVVGVVWKKEFLCSRDWEESGTTSTTTSPWAGFTGPVVVGVVWKKEFLCKKDWKEGSGE